MKTITQDQARDLLSRVKGATPVAFSALVEAKLLKTGNPYAKTGVRKLSRVQAMLGSNYENSVNRERVRENRDDTLFVAQERQWGERVGPALVEKDGQFYLAAQILKTRPPVYMAPVNGFMTVLQKDKIAAFIPSHKSATESQGVDKEVVYRNYALSNIVSLSIGGEKYRIRRDPKPIVQA